MVIPVNVGHPRSQKKLRARVEMADLVNAIENYQMDYHRFPVPTNEEAMAGASNEDFTYGGPELNAILGTGAATPLNNDVIAILADLTNFSNGQSTVNSNHVFNPQKVRYLNARFVGNTNDSGVGSDYVYRDPWGRPYIITMDLNGDKRCRDAFYRRHRVSRWEGAIGFDGLKNVSDTNGVSDLFEYHGDVMVWSLGPDGKADQSKPAHSPPNKDNVKSWQ